MEPEAAPKAMGLTSALLDQSADLLAKYTGHIGTLNDNTSKLAKIIDDNADALPDGVAAKYDELKSLVPQVSAMVQSLKDYQGTGLVDLVSKIDGDYTKAIDLYDEAMALMVGAVSTPEVKLP